MLTGNYRASRPAALLTAVVLTACNPAAAAQPCDGVDTDLTDARKAEYASLVAEDMEGKVKPSAVEVSRFMASGKWSAVYVSVPIADDGMFFFEEAGGGKRSRDVWGGMAEPSDRPELIKWAKELGAPDNLAKCFAHIIIDG